MVTKVVRPARISVVNLEPKRSRRAPDPSRRKYLPIADSATLRFNLSKIDMAGGCTLAVRKEGEEGERERGACGGKGPRQLLAGKECAETGRDGKRRGEKGDRSSFYESSAAAGDRPSPKRTGK